MDFALINSILTILGIVLGVVLLWVVIDEFRRNKNLLQTTKLSPSQVGIGVYYLPHTVLRIEVKAIVAFFYDQNEVCTKTEILKKEFSISSTNEADTRQAYALEWISNPHAKHDFSFAVNEKGLLENFTAVAESQVPKIFSVLASVNLQSDTSDGTEVLGAAQGQAEFVVQEFSQTFLEPLMEITENPKTIAWKIIANPKTVNLQGNVRIENGNFSIKSNQQSSTGNDGSPPPKWEGILFRPKRTFELTIDTMVNFSQNSTESYEEIFDFSGIDTSTHYCIPVLRTPFGKRVQKLGIQQGELRSHELEIPSTVKGFISIPIDVAKAIVSIPAQLFSIQIKQQKRNIELEKSNIELQKVIQEKRELATESLDDKHELVKSQARLAEVRIDSIMEIKRLKETIKKLKRELLQKTNNNANP